MIERANPTFQEIVQVGEYFNLFENLHRHQGAAPAFMAYRALEIDAQIVPLNIQGVWIWEPFVQVPLEYPAFTPHEPDKGFMLTSGDLKTLSQQRAEMEEEARKMLASSNKTDEFPNVFMSLAFQSLRLEISGFYDQSLGNLSVTDLQRLRLRVEFPEVKDEEIAHASFDGAVHAEYINLWDHYLLTFNTFHPSEIPLGTIDPDFSDGLPIRMPDPVLFGEEYLRQVKAKFFLAGEGLLAEYQALTQGTEVTESREFIPRAEDPDL